MNRRELVKAVAAQTDQEVRQVEATLRGITDVVTAVVSKGEPVAISGFCKFARAERKGGKRRNNFTGEMMTVKPSKKARITPLKVFKDAVITPSQAPKLAKGVWPPAPAAAPARAAAKPATRAAAKPAARSAAKPAAKATASRTRPAAKTAAKKTTTTARKAPARAR